jgi:hypothetical protein
MKTIASMPINRRHHRQIFYYQVQYLKVMMRNPYQPNEENYEITGGVDGFSLDCSCCSILLCNVFYINSSWVSVASSLLQYVSISILLFLCSVRDFSLILSVSSSFFNFVSLFRSSVHDKITNIVFDQIDKQLELVNISMNSTSQTTNQISSDCYKKRLK